MADKKLRIQNLIAKNVSEIIFSLKDDINKLASVNEVIVNEDGSIAKIYVTHLQQEKTDELIDYLNKNKKIIRQKLSKTLDIYKIPDLVFVRDDLYDKAKKIDDIISSWHKEA